VALIATVAKEKSLAVVGVARRGLCKGGRSQKKNEQSGFHIFIWAA
jgi:hypothetical protein